MAIHLYVGDDPGPYIQKGVYCGWPRSVHIRHTSWDWRDVTCVNCLGKRAGVMQLALKQAREAQTAAPQGDGDPRPLGDDAA